MLCATHFSEAAILFYELSQLCTYLISRLNILILPAFPHCLGSPDLWSPLTPHLHVGSGLRQNAPAAAVPVPITAARLFLVVCRLWSCLCYLAPLQRPQLLFSLSFTITPCPSLRDSQLALHSSAHLTHNLYLVTGLCACPWTESHLIQMNSSNCQDSFEC